MTEKTGEDREKKRRAMISGFAAMAVSVAGFSCMGLALRGSRGVFGPSTAMLWRGLVGLALVIPVALFTRTSLRGGNALWLWIRGLSGSVSLLLFFIAVSHLDLGTATALCYTYPVFASIFSAIHLRERVTFSGWIAIALSWIGIAVMVGYRPGTGRYELYGMFSGILAGVAIHSVRALRSQGETLAAILSSFFAISCLVALPGAMMESPRLGLEWSMIPGLLSVGMLATVGQAGLTLAYRHLPTRLGSPLSLVVVPLSMIGAYFLFGEQPASTAAVGSVLLFLSVAWLAHSQR
mgnify:CR=1 FL=1